MENKVLVFGAIILILFLAIAVFVKFNANGNVTAQDSDLSKYSSEKIPQECRLPQGQDLQSWKEHLGHHQNTLYCLDYYK